MVHVNYVGEAFIPAVHGDVFNQVIQRDVTVDIQELLTLSIPHLRQRLAAILDQGVQQLQVPKPIAHQCYLRTISTAWSLPLMPLLLQNCLKRGRCSKSTPGMLMLLRRRAVQSLDQFDCGKIVAHGGRRPCLC